MVGSATNDLGLAVILEMRRYIRGGRVRHHRSRVASYSSTATTQLVFRDCRAFCRSASHLRICALQDILHRVLRDSDLHCVGVYRLHTATLESVSMLHQILLRQLQPVRSAGHETARGQVPELWSGPVRS